MSEEQAQAVADFRKAADEQLIDHSSLTDEQILLLNETLKRFAETLKKAVLSVWEQIHQKYEFFLCLFEAEKKRQRRMYYRKKKSQQRNRRKRRKVSR